jgi:hypothetical protein
MPDSTHSISTNSCKASEFNELGGNDLLDAGLQAGARGWRIFPCKANKEPLIDNWPQFATTNPTTIKAWALRWKGAWWARALPPEIVLVDLDRKHGLNGVAEFERLQGCHPDQYVAPRVITGTGGIHIYTNAGGRDFKNSTSLIAPGIDTKVGTAPGFCMIPCGNEVYRWLTSPDTPMPETPQWVEVALRKNIELASPAEARPYVGWSPLGDAILKRACEAIECAGNGQQRHILNSRSLIVGHYIAGGQLEYEPAKAALIAAGSRMVNYDKASKWTSKQITFTVMNAIRDGIKTPMDGCEADRAMEEAHRKFDDDPEAQARVIEFLKEQNNE